MPSVDFSHLLRRPAGHAKKPEALYVGDYHAIIKAYEYGDANQNKTPYVRLQVGFTGWPDAFTDADKADIDLTKRQLRKDYYLTDEAFWRLDELLISAGIVQEGTEVNYEEAIPKLVGTRCMAEVKQYVNQKTNEIGNEIGKLIAA